MISFSSASSAAYFPAVPFWRQTRFICVPVIIYFDAGNYIQIAVKCKRSSLPNLERIKSDNPPDFVCKSLQSAPAVLNISPKRYCESSAQPSSVMLRRCTSSPGITLKPVPIFWRPKLFSVLFRLNAAMNPEWGTFDKEVSSCAASHTSAVRIKLSYAVFQRFLCQK